MTETERKNLVIGKGKELKQRLLDAGYDGPSSFYQATDTEEALAFLDSQIPNTIIIQDTEDMDGIAVCKALTEAHQLTTVPILLFATNNDLEQEIEAYLAGAYAYLTEPVNIELIKNKLYFFNRQTDKTEQLKTEAKSATDTALSLMVGNNELGQAIRFVERSYAVIDYQALANAFLSVTDNLQLKCALFFNTNAGALYFGTDNNISPIESDLLLRLHEAEDRIMDFNNRTVFRYPRISLLVKNMPLDDMERYGRIKDLMPSMLGAADARVGSLDTEAVLIRQTNDVSESYQHVRETLQGLSDDFTDNQKKTMKTMEKMLSELEFKLPSMGLEEDQEKYLISRVDAAVVENATINDNADKLQFAFQSISLLLDHLAQQQENILTIVMTRQTEEDESTPEEDDVELF